MFDIGAGELITLVVLAIILFGPERIPEFARKAARVIHYLRGVANQATEQIKGELGPEYANLTLADLNPKTFIQKHLLDDIQDDIDDIKSDLSLVKHELETSATEAKALASGIVDDVNAQSSDDALAAVGVTVNYDPEAT